MQMAEFLFLQALRCEDTPQSLWILWGVNAVSVSYIILNINYSVNTAYVLGRILSKQIHILF